MSATIIIGDILNRDQFREDFQRGTEFVFFPTRNGPQLFQRDRAGLLRRQRIPPLLTFIDERRQLIAVCEDCAFQVHRLPCDWRWRYLRERQPRAPPVFGGQPSAFNNLPPPIVAGTCATGACGLGGAAVREQLVEEDIHIRAETYEAVADVGYPGFGPGGYGPGPY